MVVIEFSITKIAQNQAGNTNLHPKSQSLSLFARLQTAGKIITGDVAPTIMSMSRGEMAQTLNIAPPTYTIAI